MEGRGFNVISGLVGVIVTIFIGIASVYIALMLSALPWPIITSVIMSYVLLLFLSRLRGRVPNIHEVNVAQAAGSVGGLIGAAVVFVLPAIFYINSVYGLSLSFPSFWEILIVVLLGAVLGVSLSIHYKRFSVDLDNLPFPSGTAGAETIRALFEGGRGSYLLFFALSLAFFVNALMFVLWGFPLFFVLVSFSGFVVMIYIFASLAGVGVGYIVGDRTSLSWFLGAVFGWVFLDLAFQFVGIDNHIDFVQKLGVGIVLGYGLALMMIHGRKMLRGVASGRELVYSLLLSIVSFVVLAFLLSPILALFGVLGAWVMGYIANRTTGETDIDPLEQFGLFVGLAAMGFMFLIHEAVDLVDVILLILFVSVASALAGDVGHDYKSAKVLGTRDKDIYYVDSIASVVGSVVAVVTALILFRAYRSVIETTPTVAMQSKIVGNALYVASQPPTFYVGLAIGFVMGLLPLFVPGVREYSRFVLPFGIGIFLGFMLAIPIIIGGAVAYRWGRDERGIVVASGLIAGEGLSGFILGVGLILGVKLELALTLIFIAAVATLLLSRRVFG